MTANGVEEVPEQKQQEAQRTFVSYCLAPKGPNRAVSPSLAESCIEDMVGLDFNNLFEDRNDRARNDANLTMIQLLVSEGSNEAYCILRSLNDDTLALVNAKRASAKKTLKSFFESYHPIRNPRGLDVYEELFGEPVASALASTWVTLVGSDKRYCYEHIESYVPAEKWLNFILHIMSTTGKTRIFSYVPVQHPTDIRADFALQLYLKGWSNKVFNDLVFREDFLEGMDLNSVPKPDSLEAILFVQRLGLTVDEALNPERDAMRFKLAARRVRSVLNGTG